MGFRFRKSIQIIPGIKLNIGKNGVSTTIGTRGMSITSGKKGQYINLGIPGTGISYREKIGSSPTRQSNSEKNIDYFNANSNNEISSKNGGNLTSLSMEAIKILLMNIYEKDYKIFEENSKLEHSLRRLKTKNLFKNLFSLGFSINKSKSEEQLISSEITSNLELMKKNAMNIDSKFTNNHLKYFEELKRAFEKLKNNSKIWDVTNLETKNELCYLNEVMQIKSIKFSMENIDKIRSKVEALYLENSNGGEIYIYPTFLVYIEAKNKLHIIDFKDIKVDIFVEEFKINSQENVFNISNYTWEKVNKDGSPDKRYKNNCQVPIIEAIFIRLTSITGLNELYLFNSKKEAIDFHLALNQFFLFNNT